MRCAVSGGEVQRSLGTCAEDCHRGLFPLRCQSPSYGILSPSLLVAQALLGGAFLSSDKLVCQAYFSEWAYIKGLSKKLLSFYNFTQISSPQLGYYRPYLISVLVQQRNLEFLEVLKFRIWPAMIPGQQREESQGRPLPIQGAIPEKLEAAAAGRLG